MQTIHEIEPTAATAGDTVNWSKCLPEYPSASGWTLKYALRGINGSLDITATTSGAGYLATGIVPAAGDYTLQGYVVKGSEKHTIYISAFTATPDLSAAIANYDGRSHAKRVLDAIEAVIEGRATRGDQAMIVDGTSIIKMSAEQLKLLRVYYRKEYAAEKRADAVKNGRRSGRKVLVRFI
jgi:hypothetical protein